ncbi:hypothetical protein BB8028_0001g14560 [Beauveria bassiana]|uniref:DNA mismatch repair proteins mutS family domain-containing protein n=2 Tax=Beauveria bassiana TaxID=176275 RepID=A0A2S7XZQ4_BEABA|nr:hypothetical protein BB8028_0001g14560 [Beauveria bassiana]
MYKIQSIEQFHLSEYLYISSSSLSTLQILHCELHPNSQTWQTNFGVAKKEGLSVYGMFHNLASTSQGRLQLRKLFLRPSTDIFTITARHRTISILLQHQNSEALSQMVSALRRVPDMIEVLSKLSRGISLTSMSFFSSGGLWAALERFSSNVMEVHMLTGSLSGYESAPLLRNFHSTVEVGAIACVETLVKKTIDFEQSKLRGRYCILSGVDPDLDQLKRRYDGMEDFLTQVIGKIIENTASWARQYIRSCIFLPQLGFLLVIDLDETTGQGKYSGEGQSHDTWEKMFTADGSACYKTKQMHELDEAYGDIYSQIGDREVELLHKLALNVLEYSSQLMLASQLSGELDAILALALGAQKYGWTEPDIIRDGHTRIVGGRHPLHEASMQHFIPNDFGIPVDEEGSDQKSGRVLVVTGPNHSGKSVYLKQVALIIYLAHTGSFVPADKAAVTVTDKILVCIPAQESASLNESAFATDLKKVLHSVTQATNKSLVLVDEFGKGTCPVNGAGLAAGLLDHFLSLGSRQCPRVIIATHFHEILELDYFSSDEALRLAHMEVKVKHDDIGTDDEPLTYLFLLQRGKTSFSFGEQCATMNRVPGAVVKRAGALSLIIDRDGDLTAACATLSHAEQVQLETAEQVARKFVSYDLKNLESPKTTQEVIESLDDLLS